MKLITIIATVLVTCLAVPSVQGQATSTTPVVNQAKVRGYLERALKETAEITDNDQLADALQNIARTQTQIGDVPAALQTVERIEKEIKRERRKILSLGSSLRGIAYAQAKAGNVAVALQTAEKCGKIVGETGEVGDTFALGLVAKAQAERGDLPGALATTETIKHPRSKDYALQGIAQAQVKAGDATGAKRTAENITDGKLKADALRPSAQPQTKPSDESAVKARPTAYERCNGYLEIARSLLSSTP